MNFTVDSGILGGRKSKNEEKCRDESAHFQQQLEMHVQLLVFAYDYGWDFNWK